MSVGQAGKAYSGGFASSLAPHPLTREWGAQLWALRAGAAPTHVRAGAPHPALCPQVNMAIGILVFNKLVSKDGIADKKLKERAG